MFSFQPQVPQLTEEERRALRQNTYSTATNFTLIAIGLNLGKFINLILNFY
jgi:hypothetical protein